MSRTPISDTAPLTAEEAADAQREAYFFALRRGGGALPLLYPRTQLRTFAGLWPGFG